MAKAIGSRYALSIVRTQCGTQEARLWVRRGDETTPKPQYLWQAGSLIPLCVPSAFGEGELKADNDADAITKFQSMLLEFKLIGRGLISRAQSDMLILVFPKVSDGPFPKELLGASKVATQRAPVMAMAA